MNATTNKKPAMTLSIKVPVKNVPATDNKPVLTAEQKAALKAEQAQKHYDMQLAALLAAGIPQETAEKALLALKPVKQPGRGENVKVNDFEEAIIKAVMTACKEAVSDKEYKIVPINPPVCSSNADILSKIKEKVSYFKPNASKTGKACTTPDSTAALRIHEGYIALVRGLFNALPGATADVSADKAGE